MIPYIGEECAKTHTHYSSEKIFVFCSECKKRKNTKMIINNIYKRHSIGCQCGDGFSYGHKYTFAILTQLHQEFIDNYIFDWCKFYNPYKNKEVSGEYDFVLEYIKTIIEVDGNFHRKDNNMSGQTKEESKFLDDEKDRLANEHGYRVIRIIYDDDNFNIKENIVKSDLNELFDVSKIDWLKAEEFACSNRIKEACELWNRKIYTTKEIAKIMKLDYSSIINYLNKGDKLKFCNYDGKIELKQKVIKLKPNSKQVLIFKNEVCLNIFSSCVELEKKSLNIFNIKLLQDEISQVCNGRKSQYKGFTFKYIKNLTQEEYIKYDIENKLKELNKSA
jgi:hypothetical protein